MKYCPTCQTEFDEEIIRFCTKDGTPLVEDKKPTFTENLPSETSQDDEDEGAKTIIRRNKPQPVDNSDTTRLINEESLGMSDQNSSEPQKKESKRIVISTSGEQKPQGVRSRNASAKVPPPPQKKSNTAMVVLLTILGTLALLAGGIGVWWFLGSQSDADANSNLSVNENIDINANLNDNSDDNFDLDDFNLNTNTNNNSNANSNSNIDFNLNIKTPTPTPRKTPTPKKTPKQTPTPKANSNTNTNTIGNITSPTPIKTPTLPPVKTPKPTPAKTPKPPPTNTNRPVNVGTINGRAIRLPTPAYPAAARQVKAAGRVSVSVTVDERGNVVSAKAISGHPLLRRSAETAARRSKFRPVSINGSKRKAIGTVVYNFVP